jgi:hypothetical protein
MLSVCKRLSDLSFTIRKFAPRRFNHSICVPSVGASSGLLVLWNINLFTSSIRMQESFVVVMDFISTADSFAWNLVNVYGPLRNLADLSLSVGS